MPNDSQPPDVNLSTEDSLLNKDEILNILSQEDEDGEEKPVKESKNKQEEQQAAEDEVEKPEIKFKGELSEDEEEESKDPDEEELEIAVPVKRKQILEKYPNLFKEFPYLEKAYYREAQFTELFPTMREAREAVDKASTLDKFEADVMNGNTEKVLLAIKEGDERAFRKAVDNYLPVLAKVDQSAFLHVVSGVLKHALTNVMNEGKRRGESGEPLTVASRIISQHLFGSEDMTPPAPLVREDETVNKEREKISQERENFIRERFESARTDLAGRIQNSLRATIDASIDPKNSMTDYVKRNASRDAYESLEQQMRNDTRFSTIMNTLWRRAFQEGFDKTSMDKIKSAYLSKAKTVLPNVIRQARQDALRAGQAKKSASEKEEAPIKLGKTATSITRGKSTSDPKTIPRGMKTYDYLNQD